MALAGNLQPRHTQKGDTGSGFLGWGRCRIRVIDTFGTEPAYNHEEYATLHGYRTNWGYWNLNPKQFMTMFRECWELSGWGGRWASASWLPLPSRGMESGPGLPGIRRRRGAGAGDLPQAGRRLGTFRVKASEGTRNFSGGRGAENCF